MPRAYSICRIRIGKTGCYVVHIRPAAEVAIMGMQPVAAAVSAATTQTGDIGGNGAEGWEDWEGGGAKRVGRGGEDGSCFGVICGAGAGTIPSMDNVGEDSAVPPPPVSPTASQAGVVTAISWHQPLHNVRASPSRLMMV